MIISEIIKEAWQDKFADLRSEMSLMSYKEAKQYLKTKYGITLIVEKPPAANRGRFGEYRPTTRELVIYAMLKITPDKPVAQINGFFDVLRHELTHAQQHKDGGLERGDGELFAQNLQLAIGASKYTLGRIESSVQTVDLANLLADFDIPLPAFKDMMAHGVQTITQMVDPSKAGQLLKHIAEDKGIVEHVVNEALASILDADQIRRSRGKLAMVLNALIYVDAARILLKQAHEHSIESSHARNTQSLLVQAKQSIKELYRKKQFFMKQLDKEHRKAVGYKARQ